LRVASVTPSSRVIVLGLDGGTFHLFDDLIARGWMPNLAKALERGAYGPLASVVPPYSAPAWVSFATGQNPGRHGVPDFWLPDEGGRRRPVSSRSVRSPTMWSLLSGYGRRVAVINVPVTYPPVPVNGLLISGMMTPSEDVAYTYPAELKEQLRDLAGDYAANPYANAHHGTDFLEQVSYWIRRRERAHSHLLASREWDCFINVVQAPDPLQHLFWHHLDPSHPRHDPSEAQQYLPLLETCYRAVDEVVGHRLSLVDERTTLLVLSDHGFGPAHKYFYVNRLLAQTGLLVQRASRAGIGGLFIRGRKWGMRLGRSFLRRVDRAGWRHRLGDAARRDEWRAALERASALPVDWERTVAHFTHLTGEGIVVRGADENPEASELARSRILHALRDVVDPETGRPVVSAAFRREEVLSGPWVHLAPDILFSVGDGPYLPTGKLDSEVVVGPAPAGESSGRHRPDGLFVAVGPHVRPGPLADARITDIMPTVMHLLELPVPEELDGQVMQSLLSAEYRKCHPLRYGAPPPWDDTASTAEDYSDEDIEQITKHLESLGYR